MGPSGGEISTFRGLTGVVEKRVSPLRFASVEMTIFGGACKRA